MCKNKFHLISQSGWMNDPNGFSFFDGKYHVFYQYHSWCENVCFMEWFETISDDLVKFNDVGVVLTPKDYIEGFDLKKGGCWSSSFYRYNNRNHLLYTGCRDNVQVTCVATQCSDNTYRQYEKNPVNVPDLKITQKDSFRDPYYFSYKGENYYIIGTMTYEKKGRIHLYRQIGEYEFEYVGIFYSDDRLYMFECVSLAFFEDKVVLIYSPMGIKSGKYAHQGSNCCVYQIGYINENKEFVKETEMLDLDFGYDYYAAQVLQHQEHTYLIAWICLWGKTIENIPSYKSKHVGAMTLVRELSLKENRLWISPISTIHKYFVDLYEKKIIGSYCFNERFFKLDLENTLGNSFQLKLLSDGKNYFNLMYDFRKGEISIDVHTAEFEGKNVYYDGKRYYKVEQLKKLQIFVDADIIEIYINNGEATMTAHYFVSDSSNLKSFIESDMPILFKLAKYNDIF